MNASKLLTKTFTFTRSNLILVSLWEVIAGGKGLKRSVWGKTRTMSYVCLSAGVEKVLFGLVYVVVHTSFVFQLVQWPK